MSSQPFNGGQFSLDDGTLTGPEGQSVNLRPKVATLLATLLASPNEVVSKEILVQAIWSGGVVDFEAGLSALLKELRSACVAVGLTREPSALIETLPKRGVRLNLTATPSASASESDLPIHPSPSEPPPSKRWIRFVAPMLSVVMTLIVAWIVLTLDGEGNGDGDGQGVVESKQTLVILPFEVYGGVSERARAEGLLAADTLLSELWDASLPNTSLLGRASLAPYANQDSADWVGALAQDLGASLIIEGRLIWSESTLSLNARLISSVNFEVLVSETVELERQDLTRPTQLAEASQTLASQLATHWPLP